MHHTLAASLLLPCLAGARSAQDLQLDAVVTGPTLSTQVDGAKAGDLVLLVFGLREARREPPGGQLLGVEPDLATVVMRADRTGTTRFLARQRRGATPLDCFVQAIAISPELPFDAPDGLTVSTVATVHSEGS
jgi:hypothetical protein